MTIEQERKYELFKKEQRIKTLKYKLVDTDYIDNKLTEALAIKEVTGDNSKLIEVYNQYKDILEQREEMRAEINKIEEELSSEN